MKYDWYNDLGQHGKDTVRDRPRERESGTGSRWEAEISVAEMNRYCGGSRQENNAAGGEAGGIIISSVETNYI